MKGIVFTEFLTMVEENDGYSMVDGLLDCEGLESGGIYTSVGTYSTAELFILLEAYSSARREPVSKILESFGKHMFSVFKTHYSQMIDSAGDAFSFLESIESYIHIEVRKLYPDAELPTFVTRRLGANRLEMTYHSSRKMADLAHGLIRAAVDHFGMTAHITVELMKPDGSQVRFLIESK